MESAALLLEAHEYNVDSMQVLDLVKSSSLSAYDCEFVALAKNLNCKMVTADQKIATQPPDCVVSIQVSN